jgi:predicted esterase
MSDFIHRIEPAADPRAGITLLLLHCTGGDENDLLPIGRQLAGVLPHGAHLLSPRGRILENGMPRFFRRLAEGVFDYEDVKLRAGELSKFVAGNASGPTVAVGYSNGANIAAALLLEHPGVLSGAILFRAMPPLPETSPDRAVPHSALVPVLLAEGRRDPIATPAHAQTLAAMLQASGADVETYWHPGGHELTSGDLQAAASWLTSHFGK